MLYALLDDQEVPEQTIRRGDDVSSMWKRGILEQISQIHGDDFQKLDESRRE